MKAKLLRKLRQVIINNTIIICYNKQSGILYTHLRGKTYYIRTHSSIDLINPQIGKKLEHIALKGYINHKDES